MAGKKRDTEQLEKDIHEDFKKELGHADIKDVDKFISTGSTLLDYAISNRPNGGIPMGRIIEICGNESTGKSLLAYHMMSNVQKAGGIAVYIDIERAASRSFMQRMGVNLETLITPKVIPANIEEVFDYISKIVQITKLKFPHKDKPVLVVWDSVAATSAREETEVANTEASRLGPEARAMSRCFKKNINILDEGFVTIVCINQLRTKIGVSFGDPDTTPHGKALAFYASARIKLKALKQIKDSSGRTLGVDAEARVFKNKVGPGHRTVFFPIAYDWGIQDAKSILDYLFDEGIITGAANKVLEDKELGKKFEFKHGDWEQELQTNKELAEYIRQKLDKDMIITFESKPQLDIDTDSILEVQQVKDDLEEE